MQILPEEKRIVLPAVVDRTNVKALDGALQTFCDQNADQVTLDLRDLEMIDSAGLGSLVLYQKRLKERGGELVIVSVVNDYIQHLFDTIELNRVIRIE